MLDSGKKRGEVDGDTGIRVLENFEADLSRLCVQYFGLLTSDPYKYQQDVQQAESARFETLYAGASDSRALVF